MATTSSLMTANPVAMATAGVLAVSSLWYLTSGLRNKRKGKFVILLTGASAGIGKDAALRLLREGHTVYGAARRVDAMKELVENGGHAIRMDVTDEASIKAGVAQIIKEQGKIDILVNNAGYAVYGAFEDTSMEDARRQLEVNIFGLARLTNEVLPHMHEQKSGRIINVGSMGGRIYAPFASWYQLTKHGLEALSDVMRVELRPFGIQVVLIEPGVIETEFQDEMVPGALKRSEGGRYHASMEYQAEVLKQVKGSPPSVVSKAISHAVTSRTPQRRYVCGYMAREFLMIRQYLGDGVLDSMLGRFIRP